MIPEGKHGGLKILFPSANEINAVVYHNNKSNLHSSARTYVLTGYAGTIKMKKQVHCSAYLVMIMNNTYYCGITK
jgi:hypothetical protein